MVLYINGMSFEGKSNGMLERKFWRSRDFMNIQYHVYDLPDGLDISGDIAVDTEAMGLRIGRDRLCVVQIADEHGRVHIVHFPSDKYDCKNLKALLSDVERTKIFHFGRFDIAIMQYYLNIDFSNIYCTKIASRIARTYTEHHSLKELCNELLGIRISKQQQSSNWGAQALTKEQQNYAANDVLHLHSIRVILDDMLVREKRVDLAKKCFEFLPHRARLDILGWADDIFVH